MLNPFNEQSTHEIVLFPDIPSEFRPLLTDYQQTPISSGNEIRQNLPGGLLRGPELEGGADRMQFHWRGNT